MRFITILVFVSTLPLLVGCGNAKKLKSLEEKLEQAEARISLLADAQEQLPVTFAIQNAIPVNVDERADENTESLTSALKTLNESYHTFAKSRERRLQMGADDSVDLFFLQPPFSLMANSKSIRESKLEILANQLSLTKQIEKLAEAREKGGIAPPETLAAVRIVKAQLELAILELKQLKKADRAKVR